MVITAAKLIMSIMFHPTYKILLCADDVVMPSPWCDDFRIEIDKAHKVIRLSGSFT